MIKTSTVTNWRSIGSDKLFNFRFRLGTELHIWKATINTEISYLNILSPLEKEIANRFKFSQDQQRYIVSHGVLRKILSSYLNTEPQSLDIRRSSYGKPYVVSQNVRRSIFFNMAHSKDIVCYIFSATNEVGIDIEYVNLEFEWKNIAKDFFYINEISYLKGLPVNFQTREFYKIWTQKEALLKEVGVGLAGLELNKGKPEKRAVISFTWGEDYLGAFSTRHEVLSHKYYKFSSQ
jgi:4'-phosphopantetheinyl transferase